MKPPVQNHVRYIRSYGNYSFPMDIFGSPVVENSLRQSGRRPAVRKSNPGQLDLGRPGVQLQATTNLIGGTAWTNVPGTDAMSATMNMSVTGAESHYFRLVHPLLPLE